MKKCTKCKQTKDSSEFWKDGSRGDGLNAMCKTCNTAKVLANPNKKKYSRAYSRENRHIFRNNEIKMKYGVTQLDYCIMLAEQGGECKICGRCVDDCGRRLDIDHDHETGRVRGLLCNPCNTMVERCEDREDVRSYLEAQWQTRCWNR